MGRNNRQYKIFDLYERSETPNNLTIALPPRLMSQLELEQKFNSMDGQGWMYKDQIVGEKGETKLLIFEKRS